ncbi:hypothetical protein VCNHCC010F_000237A, partial [Vibrio cholerae O1 str. NHCC-010F]
MGGGRSRVDAFVAGNPPP